MSELKCPICDAYDENDHFTCPNCGRDNICGNHHDVDYLMCSDCATKERKRSQKKTKKKKKATIAAAPAPEAESKVPEEIKTPFNFKKVACPICETVSSQRMFKAKCYSEQKVDIDKHVLKFGWVDKDFNNFHPPLYYYWHCPNCKFTESYLEFENPGKPTWSNFREMKERYPTMIAEQPSTRKLIKWLGKDVDYEKVTFLMAFRLHILAIYIQEIMDTRSADNSDEDEDEDEDDEEAGEDLRDPLKLGRFYLRLGWLLKEMREGAEEELKSEKAPAEEGEDGKPKKKSKARREELATARKILKELGKVWEDVPPTEGATFLRAAQFMTLAFERHPAIKNVAAATDMLLWIAGIYLCMNQEKKGLETLNQVLGSGQKAKTKMEIRMKNANMSPEEEKQLNKWLSSVDRSIAKARDLMADIQYKKNQVIKAKAKKLIAKMEGQEPDVIRARLAKEGIKTQIIDAMMPAKKKKKLFGLF